MKSSEEMIPAHVDQAARLKACRLCIGFGHENR